MDGAVAVPREALVDGSAVWTLTPDDRLARTEVTVGWTDESTVFVLDGLADGTRVIVTPPSLPIEGAPVRPKAIGEADKLTADAPAPTPSEG